MLPSTVEAYLRVLQLAVVGLQLVLLRSIESSAAGDDTLHEGHAGSVGVRTDRSVTTQLGADLAIFPFPGGPDYWGGAINATRLDLTLDTSARGVGFEQGRAQFIRWPHLHVLGLERDTRAGYAYGVELVGLYVPVPLWGNIGSRDWAIATIGADLGYRRQLTHAGAQHAGHVGYTTPEGHVELQHQLGERTQLRGFADVAYTFGAGKLVGEPGASAEQLLELGAGVGLYVDVTCGAPSRLVPRTDPATGVITHLRVVNEGKRWRVILLDLSGSFRPVDSISSAPAVATVKAGLSHEY